MSLGEKPEPGLQRAGAKKPVRQGGAYMRQATDLGASDSHGTRSIELQREHLWRHGLPARRLLVHIAPFGSKQAPGRDGSVAAGTAMGC